MAVRSGGPMGIVMTGCLPSCDGTVNCRRPMKGMFWAILARSSVMVS